MRILLDTSIWVECNEDNEFKKAVNSLIGKHTLLSSETVDQEIGMAAEYLSGRESEGAKRLESFYEATPKEPIPVTEEVRLLANEYLAVGKRVGLPLKKMKADVAIVAAAVVGFADIILTLNRKTMASDYAKIVYLAVNQPKGLRTPHFITEKDAILKLASEF